MDNELLARIDAAALELGIDRSTWIRDACLTVLDGRRKLSRQALKAVATGTPRCRHPVNRRIGSTCAICGALVGT